jgi:hypothetical protein
MGADSLRDDRRSRLSGSARRLAQSSNQPRYSVGIPPRTGLANLCSRSQSSVRPSTSDQNVVGLVQPRPTATLRHPPLRLPPGTPCQPTTR